MSERDHRELGDGLPVEDIEGAPAHPEAGRSTAASGGASDDSVDDAAAADQDDYRQ